MAPLLLDVGRLNNWNRWSHDSPGGGAYHSKEKLTSEGLTPVRILFGLFPRLVYLSKVRLLLSCQVERTATINHLRRKIKSISQVGVVRCQLTYPRSLLVQTLRAEVRFFALFRHLIWNQNIGGNGIAAAEYPNALRTKESKHGFVCRG